MDETAVRERLEKRRRELGEIRNVVEAEVLADEEQAAAARDLGDAGADDATDTLERERAVSVEASTSLRIQEVEDAIRRLEAGRYGRCEACGAAIPQARLKARPEARFCVEHQAEAERRD